MASDRRGKQSRDLADMGIRDGQPETAIQSVFGEKGFHVLAVMLQFGPASQCPTTRADHRGGQSGH